MSVRRTQWFGRVVSIHRSLTAAPLDDREECRTQEKRGRPDAQMPGSSIRRPFRVRHSETGWPDVRRPDIEWRTGPGTETK